MNYRNVFMKYVDDMKKIHVWHKIFINSAALGKDYDKMKIKMKS